MKMAMAMAMEMVDMRRIFTPIHPTSDPTTT
jgi:hypothetical protein